MTEKFQQLYLPAILISLLFLCGCRQHNKSISFYYWKTRFHLDTVEKQTLADNTVKRIYTRYFDVDFLPEDSSALPVAPIIFDTTAIAIEIVPVVYLKNRVFERFTATNATQLAKKVFAMVAQINRSANLNTNEIQFDCDWTDKTRDSYFHFLQAYHSLSKQIISATIRLHQVKYAARTGIPPVNYGVLMYYNMGEINAGTTNSIYDPAIAARYTPSIQTYPLILDIALPVFAWSQQLREGRVIKLLNKMNFLHFENDSNFIVIKKNRYVVKHACFHGGYYFQENDTIKTEQVTEKDLLDIVQSVNRYSNHRIRNLIFYDLDKENLALYEKKVFRKIMDHTD